MEIERLGNLIEAGVWFALAAALLLYALRRGRAGRRRLLTLAVVLALLGGSDLVEARTGAWWTPWCLFVWKAICVVVLFGGFAQHVRVTKRARSQGAETRRLGP
jgi:hypothetical protein